MSEFLYRLRDIKGGLLYVGITQDWPTRMKQHQADKPWWSEVMAVELVRLDCSRQQTEAIEKAVIKTEQPTYNVTHNAEVRRMKLPTRRQPATSARFDPTFGQVIVLTENTPTTNVSAWLDEKVKHQVFGTASVVDYCTRDDVRYLVVQVEDTGDVWFIDCANTAYEVVNA